MFGKKSLIAAAIIGMSASTMALAQDDTSLAGRQWELILNGTGNSAQDFDSNAFGFTGQLGYYWTPQWQVNFRQGLSWGDTEAAGSVWTAATRVGVDYHFDLGQDQRFIPFVGVEGGYLYGDLEDSFTAGIEGGVKAYVNDTTFIYGSVLYEYFFNSGDDIDSGFDDGQFVYGLGIGFRW